MKVKKALFYLALKKKSLKNKARFNIKFQGQEIRLELNECKDITTITSGISYINFS